jgi:hypothetical protein
LHASSVPAQTALRTERMVSKSEPLVSIA